MYYLMTYGVRKHGSNRTRFMHKVTREPLLDLMTLQHNNPEADYVLINTLEIDKDKYLTQSIDSIKMCLEFY